MKIPIACTLSAEAATDRIEEWRAVLASTVTAVSQPAPTRQELRLCGAPESIAALVDLARREKACCAFFHFGIEVEADWVTLVVEVPVDATEALAGFAALAPIPGRLA